MRCLAFVRFPAPAGLTGARLRAVMEQSVPRYQGLPGLHRKYFVGDGAFGGGVYEWDSREAAEAFYDAAWHERIRSVYGAVPEIQLFDIHAVVDNDAGSSRIDA